MLQDADALPQLIGDFKPLDQWQTHLNRLFYGLRGDRLRSYYQTFASADYRLAHALAADYFEKVVKRDATRVSKSQHATPGTQTLTVMELGPGNGNLAACFLSHLKAIDTQGAVYPRVRYVMVDWEQPVLDGALAHPDLAAYRNHVEIRCASIERFVVNSKRESRLRCQHAHLAGMPEPEMEQAGVLFGQKLPAKALVGTKA